jgi:hypothetical protein
MTSRVLTLLALLLGPAMASAAWPDIPFPRGTRVESVGDQVRLNGIPMRMHRALANKSAKELIEFYRNALGQRRAEQRVGDRHIIAQEQSNYFTTIQIRPLSANVTEVLVSTSDMVEAKQAANRPLGFVLPAESGVLSDMESTDAGNRSRQLVISNRHDLETNLQSLTRELAARGFYPDGAPLRASKTEHVQLFKGTKREAQLTLARKDGHTSIVLTTITNP